MPFYLCPGDTLDITICFHDGDVPDCRYRGGHSAEVARLLKVRNDYLSLQKHCRFFEGDIEAYNHFADSLYTTWQRKIGAIADAHHFTSFERRLAECDMAAVFGTAYLSYFLTSTMRHPFHIRVYARPDFQVFNLGLGYSEYRKAA